MFQSTVIAVVVPEVDCLKAWARANGIGGTLSVLCVDPDVKSLILEDITELGKTAGLKSFEQVSRDCMVSVVFSPFARSTVRYNFLLGNTVCWF